MERTIHPVNKKLPLFKLITLGMQHVLVMYSGAIVVPIIIGSALKLSKADIGYLVSADLFCCGLVSIIQSLGIWKFGIRLPVMMGVTFAAVGPIVAMANNPNLTILHIYGAVIAAGVFCMLVSPFMNKLIRYFPPVVTGSVITIIGISLMGVGINWSAGGMPHIETVINGVITKVPNPNYGLPINLEISLAVLLTILIITKYTQGFIASISILISIALGFILSLSLGKANLNSIAQADWFALITPFHFGFPLFDFGSIVSMCIVMIVTMIESTGMFIAVGDIVDKKVDEKSLIRGLSADGLGTFLGGLFNTFPYTSFSQNVGLVCVTGIRSRYVCVTAGVILMILGTFPKLSQIATSIPEFVLGGAGIVMFGTVTTTGIKILSKVNFHNNRNNSFIVGISIGIGMIPLIAPTFFQNMPAYLNTILHSGILLTSLTALLLNLFFNGSSNETSILSNSIVVAESADF